MTKKIMALIITICLLSTFNCFALSLTQVHEKVTVRNLVLKDNLMLANDTSRSGQVSVYEINNDFSYLKGIPLSGAIKNLAIRGDYLFAVCSTRLTVFDISDINNIVQKGYYSYDEHSKYPITFTDDYVILGLTQPYGGDNSNGIVILEASDSVLAGTNSSTMLTAVYNKGKGQNVCAPYQIYADGNYLYAASECLKTLSNPLPGALMVFDISDPSELFLLASRQITNGGSFAQISDITMDKGSDFVYLAICDGQDLGGGSRNINGVWVFDTSLKNDGEIIGTYLDLTSADGTGKRLPGIYKNGSYLYVTSQDIQSTIVYKITGSPTERSSYEKLHEIKNTSVFGSIIYSGYRDSLFTIDVQNELGLRVIKIAPEFSSDSFELNNSQMTAHIRNNGFSAVTPLAIAAVCENNKLSSLKISEKEPINGGEAAVISMETGSGSRIISTVWDSISDMNILSVGKSAGEISGNYVIPQSDEAITVGEADDNIVVNINTSYGAGESAAILVKNISVPDETDKFGGIRYIDSQLTDENGEFHFVFSPTDGGTYEINIKINNQILKKEISVPNAVLSLVNNTETAGNITDIILNIKNIGNIFKMEFEIEYPIGFILQNDAEFSEAVTGNVDISESGVIKCSVQKNQPCEDGTMFLFAIGAEIPQNTPLGLYNLTLKNIKAYDNENYPLYVDGADSVITVAETSPKQEMIDLAVGAIQALKNANEITYDNFSSLKLSIENAKDKVEAALENGVREKSFPSVLYENYKNVVKKAADIQKELDIIIEMKAVSAVDFDNIFIKYSSIFKIDNSLVAYYLNNLTDKIDFRSKLKGVNANNIAVFSEKFCQNLVIEKIKQTVWGEIEVALINLNSVINLNLNGDYKNFNSAQKEIVHKAIARTEFETIEKLAAAFSSAVTSARGGGATGGITTGGGGGGGSSSSVKISPVMLSLPEYAPETEKPNKSAIFTDLGTVAWAENQILTLYEKNIVSGNGDGLFRPDDYLLREEFIKMLVLAFEIKSDGEKEFSDVSEDKWYFEYIQAANEVVNGYPDGRFGVGERITREDMVVLLYRVYSLNNSIDTIERDTEFNDFSTIELYAREAVLKMYKAGFVAGTGDNNFSPKWYATRAMAAKIICDMVF